MSMSARLPNVSRMFVFADTDMGYGQRAKQVTHWGQAHISCSLALTMMTASLDSFHSQVRHRSMHRTRHHDADTRRVSS